MRYLFTLLAILLFSFSVVAEESFSNLVGDVQVKPVSSNQVVEVPWITWGGDVVLFYANGLQETTKPDSIFGKFGLKIKLVPGDDYVGQVKAYLEGRPFLRGTFRMLGQSSEVIGNDPRTKPYVILQETWSKGDYIVGKNIATLNDLKGKKIALQRSGPHVGLLDDALKTAKLTWDDIEPVWVDALSGPDGPAEKIRQDNSVDVACVITPDMIGLCGGFNSVGTGVEGTVKDARVVVSTQELSRSIADVYGVRSDWYGKNKDWVAKFVAGYLAATEKIIQLRKEFDSTGKMPKEYENILLYAQQEFNKAAGEEIFPTIEEDVHGLLLDAAFVGLPGNISFFREEGNLAGFASKQQAALDLAVNRGYAKTRIGFVAPDFDYQTIAKLAGIKYVAPQGSRERIIAESIDLFPDSESLDSDTIASFSITFEANQFDFPVEEYGAEFQHAIESSASFGNAVWVVRGHADPTQVLLDLIKAGQEKGIITRSGSKAKGYEYFVQSRPVDLENTKSIVDLIKRGVFDNATANPRDTLAATMNLSQLRAENVVNAVASLAKDNNWQFDPSQVQPVGVGILEPLIAKPKNYDEAKKNMRVEFRLIRVPAEAIKSEDFDY